MKGLRRRPVAAGGEAEDSRAQGALGRVGAVLTKPGRIGTARRCGSGERDEKVYERNQCVKLRKRRAGSNLVDVGRCAVHACHGYEAGDSEAGMYRPVGRPRGRTAAYSWRGCRGLAGHLPRRTVDRERGNPLRSPFPPGFQCGDGQVRGRLMSVGWGGGLVVVRAHERCAHGEGDQQGGKEDAGMPGDRW